MATSGSGGNLMFSAGISFAKTGTATDKEINAELNRIQHLINSKQLWVKLGVDPSSKTFLQNYNKSADQLEKKMRDVAKSIQELQKRGKYWDANGMTAQAQKLQQIYHELSVLRKTSSLKANEFEKMIVKNINEEVKAQERAEKAAQRKAEAMKRAADRQSNALQKVNGLFGVQDGYVQNLIARLATYASIGAIGSFLTKVREVTAEFELQRVSLGAIIQDQNRANALFSEIKSYALKSPVKILDLTRYTKQLAAYQIETEKLFDTTKRLTDVSVGLGVDMSRLILAYGETKASNVMNAKELRQFAMMGIPMLELLSEKLSEIYGKTISTGEAFQMIKKRMVHFDVVAQIFEDLTNKGGTFYNMQEKQGNTLYGMWAKLGDAASVMYDQIGNTGWVNEGMRGFINVLRSLMLAWRDVGRVMFVAATGFAIWKVNSAIIQSFITRTLTLNTALRASSKAHIANNAAIASGNKLAQVSTYWKLKSTQATLAAIRTNKLWEASLLRVRAAWYSFASVLSANAPALILTAIVSIWMKLDSIIEKANRLKNALNDIRLSSLSESSKSVRNFESLANAAVQAKDGSKEQRDALEELHTTYGKILPQQDLQIEKLRALKGNYTSLTESVREYVAAQKQQEGITTILEDYAPKIKSAEDTIKNVLKGGFNYATEFGEDFLSFQDEQVDRMIENAKRLSKDTSMSMQQVWEKVFRMEGIDFKFDEANAMKINLDLIFGMDKLTEVIRKQEDELGKWDNEIKALFPTLGLLSNLMKEAQEEIENADYHAPKTTFLFDEEKTQKSIEIYVEKLKEAFNKAGLEINLDDYIHFNEDGKFDRLDWTALTTRLDELSNIADQKEQELRAKRDAYNKQYQAELAKGKDADNKKAQEYYANMTQVIEQLNNLVPIENVKNMANEVQGLFEDLVPKDILVRNLRQKLIEISGTYGFVGEGMDKMRQYFWSGEKDLKSHIDELEKERDKLKNTVYGYKVLAAQLGLTNAQMFAMYNINLEEETRRLEALGKIIEDYKKFVPADAFKKGKGSKQSDPRLQMLNNIASTIEKINKEYDDLLKKEGQTQALADTQRLFAEEFANLQNIADKYKFKLPAFEVPKNSKEVKQWYEAIIKEIKRLGLKDADRVLIDLGYKEGKVDIDELQKQIDQKLKQLQSRIEQSKTAREFYDKILSATGDVDIAANVTMSIYGEDGTALQAEIAQQITEMFGSFQVDVPVEIVSPENRVDYTALQRFLDEHRDEWADKDQFKALEKLASEGQKASAQQVEAWFKEIQKAKDYAQQRVDIETNLANKIASIRAMMLPKDVEETLISGMTEKSAQELDKLQYEAFKDSPMYIELFQDLEHASTTALTAMRDRLMALKGQWRNLNPTQIKELTNAIQKLDEQIIRNNPFKAIVDNLTSLRKMKSQKVLDENLKTELAKLQQAEEKLANASKEYAEAQTEVENAETDVAIARKKLNDAIENGDYDAVKQAQAELNERVKILETIKEANADNVRIAKRKKDEAEEEYNKQKEITDAAEEEANARKETVQNIAAANQSIDQYQSIINDVLGDVREMMDALGADDLDLQFFDDIVQGLNQIVDAGQAAATAVGAFMTGNLFTGITQSISAVSGFITGFINLFYAGRVRKANKEIEKQQKLLEQLEYSYGRLQKAQEKLFGSDYISNYNQQLANLAAQAEAYRKQAEAERSKGKKADKDKIKDYEDSWRETMDEIKDMQDDLAAHIAGTDITSAARDFANSWLEARWAFEDTTEAMREKFADMVQNMIVESMAAKIMESLLEPIYKEIKLAAADTNFTTDEIARIAAMTTETTEKMNNAMETMLEQLQAAGLDLSQMFSEGGTELTGIARDYATASEESINGLAQGVNTQNFYLSYVPSINENVSAIRILMEGGAVAQVGGDYNSLANEHLAQLPIIASNTLATAERCERAAVACEEMANNIRRVVAAKGGTFVLRTTLN